MRLVCIEDSKAIPGSPIAKRGNIYTAIDKKEVERYAYDIYTVKAGLYYLIIEINRWCHSSIFIIINEDQQDETEFERAVEVKEMKS